MAIRIRKRDALNYHSKGRPGKIEVIPTKETKSQRDLSLAYSPGVAEACLEIANNPQDVYKYTAKGNLVGVISNGTAVLGLGNIGPEASKPVMEGKGILFKIYADIDVFDIELDANDIDTFVKVVKSLEPTFGGINLEDIKAPECFEIEEKLKKALNIPVMHDDQHGTAIIASAALLNASEIAGKVIEDLKIVVSGAGASAISCTNLFLSLGAKLENIAMFDSKGLIKSDRKNIEKHRAKFATKRNFKNIEDALDGADMFLGLSQGGLLEKSMIKNMAKNPIIFALANPDPEIAYKDAISAREDAIVATGRSDYPNQVNNVLGFPFIFRGALDVAATEINEEMKLAAVKAIAELAKEAVPEGVMTAYNMTNLSFGNDYILPKPMDPRLLTRVAPAVAKAAINSKVSRLNITDWDKYSESLEKRMGRYDQLIRRNNSKAKSKPKKVVFGEADNLKILMAANIVNEEGIAKPILLGNLKRMQALIEEHNLDLQDCPMLDPRSDKLESKRQEYGEMFFEKRSRRGYNLYEAAKIMRERNYFGMMMVENGEADAFISGLTREYPETIKPALQIIGVKENIKRVAGMYILLTNKGPLFLADTTVNVNPSSEDLVNIALLLAQEIEHFKIKPKIALLSYSNFGSVENESPIKVRKAVKYLHENHPEINVDGEMQANLALNPDLLMENYPFCELGSKGANALIFPNLDAGNIAYKLLQEIDGSETIGPILMGLKKPVHILQLGSSIREIVNMVTIAVLDAQKNEA